MAASSTSLLYFALLIFVHDVENVVGNMFNLDGVIRFSERGKQ